MFIRKWIHDLFNFKKIYFPSCSSFLSIWLVDNAVHIFLLSHPKRIPEFIYFVDFFVLVFDTVFHSNFPWISDSPALVLKLQIHLASLVLRLQIAIHGSCFLESIFIHLNYLAMILKLPRYSLNLSISVHFISCRW